MNFWKAAGEYVVVVWNWVDYPITLYDFTFRVWHIALFFFVMDLLLYFLGLRVREEMQIEKGIRIHKKYKLHYEYEEYNKRHTNN